MILQASFYDKTGNIYASFPVREADTGVFNITINTPLEPGTLVLTLGEGTSPERAEITLRTIE